MAIYDFPLVWIGAGLLFLWGGYRIFFRTPDAAAAGAGAARPAPANGDTDPAPADAGTEGAARSAAPLPSWITNMSIWQAGGWSALIGFILAIALVVLGFAVWNEMLAGVLLLLLGVGLTLWGERIKTNTPATTTPRPDDDSTTSPTPGSAKSAMFFGWVLGLIGLVVVLNSIDWPDAVKDQVTKFFDLDPHNQLGVVAILVAVPVLLMSFVVLYNRKDTKLLEQFGLTVVKGLVALAGAYVFAYIFPDPAKAILEVIGGLVLAIGNFVASVIAVIGLNATYYGGQIPTDVNATAPEDLPLIGNLNWDTAYWPYIALFLIYLALVWMIKALRGTRLFLIVFFSILLLAFVNNDNLKQHASDLIENIKSGELWSELTCQPGTECRTERDAAEAERLRLLRETEAEAEAARQIQLAAAQAEAERIRLEAAEAAERRLQAECDSYAWTTHNFSTGRFQNRAVREFPRGYAHQLEPSVVELVDDPAYRVFYSGSATNGQFVPHTTPGAAHMDVWFYRIEADSTAPPIKWRPVPTKCEENVD